MANLNTPVRELAGVTSAFADKLAKLRLLYYGDLLWHLPTRYLDRSQITPIGQLTADTEYALVIGVIQGTRISRGRRSLLFCQVADDTGVIELCFFHYSPWQAKQLTAGTKICCYGRIKQNAQGLQLLHPEYELVKNNQQPSLVQGTLAVYPSTEGVNQQRLRRLCRQAVKDLVHHKDLELLPASVRQEYRLADLAKSLKLLHQPDQGVNLQQLAEPEHPARRRLIIEELLAHHLSLLQLKHQVKSQQAPALRPQTRLYQQLLDGLPFDLTSAQQRVHKEISHDLSQSCPMLRLVQGDVGSGKTLVAVLAALQAIGNGCQVALMAPTEVLAEQHYQNLTAWLTPLDIEVACLAGKQKASQQRQQLAAIGCGEVQLVVGTHALFQQQVDFQQLALIIVDEQHRFGVHQRLALRNKGVNQQQVPHQLIMTATPIPRTLAMSVYADLDTSIIDQLPGGRQPVTTVLVSSERRDALIERVRHACQQGRQVYWVCTLVEESEVLNCQAAASSAEQLQQQLPQVKVGLVHGRLTSEEKNTVLQQFKTGEVQLLVATTVIEVGVDVPNASLMIIENPERLGLAQLHQLRGRVGRGSVASHCVLLYQTPLSWVAKKRLQTIRQTNDGFKIAEQDLAIRGPGEVLGARQTGLVQLRVADLARDCHLIPQVQLLAEQINQQNPQVANRLIERWLSQRLLDVV
jgi:ATP-dependent DNA helicase RecG